MRRKEQRRGEQKTRNYWYKKMKRKQMWHTNGWRKARAYAQALQRRALPARKGMLARLLWRQWRRVPVRPIVDGGNGIDLAYAGRRREPELEPPRIFGF